MMEDIHYQPESTMHGSRAFSFNGDQLLAGHEARVNFQRAFRD